MKPGAALRPAALRAVLCCALVSLGADLASPRPGSTSEARRDPRPPPGEGRDLIPAEPPESAPTRLIDGETRLGVNDLARLLEATKFWRADVRKLVVRTRAHRIVLTVDNPFVLIDDRTIRLATPVRSVGGELQVPVALVDSLPRDTLLARLRFDPARRVVLQVPPGGVVERPRVTDDGAETVASFPVDRPEDVVVASRSRAHFRLRFGGFFVGTRPELQPAGGLVFWVRLIPAAIGTAFELAVAREAVGFRLAREPGGHHVILSFSSRAGPDLERFAPEGSPGPRPLGVVVLDPGHGGEDAGVSVPGAVEKQLTLALAKLLKVEIERRMPTRVLLTREDDRTVSVNERAERANRARADLVLSLHFGGFVSSVAKGATVFCPPATFEPEPSGGTAGAGSEIEVLPWRDVATRHAVRSRQLADAVLSSLELHGDGPTRLREILPYPLLGVNAPGVLLECGTLTSESERRRLTEDRGLGELAATIADALVAYRKSE